MKYFLIILFLFSLLAAEGGVSRGRADFLIVANPSNLSLFDQSKQSLSLADKAAFLPGAPFQIIDVSANLGSELDYALKFSYNNTVYYASTDDKGALSGVSKADCRLIKNAALLNDTVRISKANRATLAGPSGKTPLTPDDILVRLFSSNNQAYVKLMGKKSLFGFCALPNDAFAPVKSAPVNVTTSVILPNEWNSITERLTNANQTYQAFFGHFNKVTGQEKSVPSWSWQQRDGRVSCRMNGPRLTLEELKESTEYIVRDIENIFIGKNMSVRYQDNEITVEPRNL